jgi:beta-glucanase (GH16 family)
MRATLIASVILSAWLAGCGSNAASDGDSSAGGTAGSATGTGGGGTSSPSGGSGVAGSAGGGAANLAGAASGGTSSTGTSSAGAASGGTSNAGAASGGASNAGAASGGSAGAAITAPAGYKLVWHDEFDVDGAPNPANWKFEKGFVRNEEAQWYQPDNASVQGGMLVIEARKETVQNPNYTGTGDWKTTRKTADYTSSSLNTSGLQSFQYGHFEMRGRIPTDAGMWPAWWTLGVSGEWPSNGEIDIMEYYQNKVLANVACGTSTRYQAKWDSATKQLSTLGADWTSQFHVWTMDWDDQNIVLSLDGQQMNTSALSSMLNADGTSPFKQKDYILLNLALGGQNGGDPSATSFPKRYEVDYVRVFQKQ